MTTELEMLKSATESFVNIIRGTLEYQEQKKKLLEMGKNLDYEHYWRYSICYDLDDCSYTIGNNIEGDYGLSVAYAWTDDNGVPIVNEHVFAWEK